MNDQPLCDKCPNTFKHKEHSFCNGCFRRVPIPLGQKFIINSQPHCEQCPADSTAGRVRDMFKDVWKDKDE